MKALIWISVCILQIFVFDLDLLSPLRSLAILSHQTAKSFLEGEPSHWNWFYKAILIGDDEGIRNQPELQAFFKLGLYHLIVVSGSHIRGLQFIATKMTNPLPRRFQSIIVTLTLVFFTLINQLQASCTRALVAWGLCRIKLNRPRFEADLNMIVICLCLIIKPSWAESLSFNLSCAATLGLAISKSLDIRVTPWNRLTQSVSCTLITAPLIFSIQPCLSWLVIPSNTLALPVFEIVLMPVSLLNVAFPALRPVTENLFVLIFSFSDWLSDFENPLICIDERNWNSWGLLYIGFVYISWRFVLPFYLRHQFWRFQSIQNGS